MISFSCPHCSQGFEADETWQGKSVECPTCLKIFVAPGPSQSAPAIRKRRTGPARQMRQLDCPVCRRGHQIASYWAGATRCVECGFEFRVSAESTSTEIADPKKLELAMKTRGEIKKRQRAELEGHGWIVGVVFILGFFLTGMAIVRGEPSTLVIGTGTMILSGIMLFFHMRAWREHKRRFPDPPPLVALAKAALKLLVGEIVDGGD